MTANTAVKTEIPPLLEDVDTTVIYKDVHDLTKGSNTKPGLCLNKVRDDHWVSGTFSDRMVGGGFDSQWRPLE